MVKAKSQVISVMGTLHPFKQQVVKEKGMEVSRFVTKVFVETNQISGKWADPFMRLFDGDPVMVKIVSDVDGLPTVTCQCTMRGVFRQAVTKSANYYTFPVSIPAANVDLNNLSVMCSKKMAALELSLAQLEVGVE